MHKQFTIWHLLALASLLYLPFLGVVHLFDWDEINFAEAAREMLVTGNYLDVQIDYKLFWEKPPLFIWMQAICMKIFGVNEFAARLPNALAGLVTLAVLYKMGSHVKNKTFGLLWASMYLCSILPFFYFKSGIIDPWFNLFIFSGIYFAIVYTTFQQKGWYAAMAGVCIGLAILTKGPVALLVFGLTSGILVLVKKFRVSFQWLHLLWFLAALLMVGGSWFFVQIAFGNTQNVIDFIVYQIRLFRTKDAGHGGFLLYHFVILFFGVFPASVFALTNLWGSRKSMEETNETESRENMIRLWIRILFWVVLLLFTYVSTKIIHYSSLCYFPLTFLATEAAIKWQKNEGHVRTWQKGIFAGLAVLIGLVYTIVAAIEWYKPLLLEKVHIKDPFAVGNLGADVSWSGFEIIPGLLILLAIWFVIRLKAAWFVPAILALSLLFSASAVMLLTPKVEKYSQHAMIEFCKAKEAEHAVVVPIGFKSYAHLFYTKKNLAESAFPSNADILSKRPEGIKIYGVIKINKKEKTFAKYPFLKLLYEKNGFVFVEAETKE